MGTTDCLDRRRDESDRTGGEREVVLTWAVALGATKAADVATTAAGLGADAALVERNPLAVAVMAEVGVLPGLLALGGVTVAAIVVFVEAALRLSIPRGRADGRVDRRTGRAVCYAVGCGCNLAIAAHNAVLVAGTAAFAW